MPPLDETLDRYLEYAAVVAAGQPQMHLHSTIDAVQKFRTQGKPLQEKLLKIAEKELNWVSYSLRKLSKALIMSDLPSFFKIVFESRQEFYIDFRRVDRIRMLEN